MNDPRANVRSIPQPGTDDNDRHLRAALRFAQEGYAVFPAHEPIFDKAGQCIGCTCEKYKRSEEYHQVLIERRKEHEFDPNYICPQPGKCPRVKWRESSTTNADQIRQWWNWWPTANIGIDCGKSGLLTIDLDTYKEEYNGAYLRLDENTVTVITGGGGTHLWYRMPAGADYGNSKGKLPAGIDVRGRGGYVIAPPSLHKSGRRYLFEIGFDPRSLEPALLPAVLIDILDGAQSKLVTHQTVFTTTTTEPPDLNRWRLSDKVRTLIDEPPARGGRSEADARVCVALAYAGASDDDILAVFQHRAIGTHGKYAERGDNYLSITIAHARAFVAEHPPAVPREPSPDPNIPLPVLLAYGHEWGKSGDCSEVLRKAGFKRIEGPRKLLTAMLNLAGQVGGTAITTSLRNLAAASGLSHMTAGRYLRTFVAAGLVEQHPTHLRLSFVASFSLDVTAFSPPVNAVTSSENDDFYADHLTDDAFQIYPYRYAVRRLSAPTVWVDDRLSSGALLAWDALDMHGSLDAGAFAEIAGLSVASARGHLNRLRTFGYARGDRELATQPIVYSLVDGARERLDERRPAMQSYGLAMLRNYRTATLRSAFAGYESRLVPEGDQRERTKLRTRELQQAELSRTWAELLADAGIDATAKVGDAPPRRRRGLVRIDRAEELETKHRPIWEAWDDLGDMLSVEKRVALVLAGWDSDAVDVALAERRRVNRQFMGARSGTPADAESAVASDPSEFNDQLKAHWQQPSDVSQREQHAMMGF